MVNNKIVHVSEILKVLANPIRLNILYQLEHEEMCSCHMQENLTSISQPALSQHLKILKAHKILIAEKRGQHIFYSISSLEIKKLIISLRDIF
ncbi:MAG: ArsR/SmtB family transcription factor [Fusobacteriaceae bacterium]